MCRKIGYFRDLIWCDDENTEQSSTEAFEHEEKWEFVKGSFHLISAVREKKDNQKKVGKAPGWISFPFKVKLQIFHTFTGKTAYKCEYKIYG